MNPLVSVCIPTYNSSSTIVETLDSVSAQTYSEIELIVSDDQSTDNTVSIVEEWIKANNSRFINTKLIKNPVNRGVTANLNEAIKQSTGDWIKDIGADDILMPDCIETNVSFIKNNPQVDVLFSNDIMFFSDGKPDRVIKPNQQVLNFYNAPAEEQHELLWRIRGNQLRTLTLFWRTETAKNNLYNEKYRNLEDWPKWFELTKKNIKIWYMDKDTVRYRIGYGTNMSIGSTSRFTSDVMFDTLIFYYYDYLKPGYKERGLDQEIFFWEKQFAQHYLYKYTMDNRKTLFRTKIINLIFKLLKLV